jgi:hypothetical protein
MKKYLILFLIPFFFSCGPSDEELKLKSQVDSLMSITSGDEATITEYLKAFNEIQQNLNEIKFKENIITTKTVGDVELEETDVEGITNDILAIHALMQENKRKLSYLRSKISKSNSKNKELKTTIKLLNDNIVQKDLEISNLTNLLEQKDFDISALNIKIAEMDSTLAKTTYDNIQKDSTITVKEDALHIAYFIVADKKSLKAKGVLKKDGGFMGIGGNTKVKMNDGEFTKIDTREIQEFNLNNAKKVKIITDHPDGSYELQKGGDSKYTKLVISNVDDFWKMSKYLVIQIK